MQGGDIFVARPHEPHEIVSSPDDHLGIYFWAYNLTPTGHRTSAGSGALFSSFASSRRAVAAAPAAMDVTLALLTEEIAHRESGYRDAVDGLARKLLLDTARVLVDHRLPEEGIPTSDRGANHIIVAQIIAYLHDNYTRPVAIRDVAAQVHLSERHTARLFHAMMGVSIGEYLTGARMDMASQLLLEGRLAIKEVARAVGYADVRHFTTRFRDRTGLPPAAFRRRRVVELATPSP
ncbi:MAG: hypothetical protein NVSMB52_00490 [Chloroflexota bacterium]